MFDFSQSINFTLSKSERLKNLNEKKVKADKIIRLHCAGAFSVGFCPIPFSDAPLILANQVALIDRILSVYERNELRELITALLSEIGLGFIVSKFAIKSAAYLTGQLLKAFPCLGTVAGGLINGSIAAAITYGYGVAISDFCYRKIKASIYKESDSAVTNDDIINFTQVFTRAFKEFSSFNKASQAEYDPLM